MTESYVGQRKWLRLQNYCYFIINMWNCIKSTSRGNSHIKSTNKRYHSQIYSNYKWIDWSKANLSWRMHHQKSPIFFVHRGPTWGAWEPLSKVFLFIFASATFIKQKRRSGITKLHKFQTVAQGINWWSIKCFAHVIH